MNNLARYLASQNAPTVKSRRTLRSDLSRWWAWCGEQAAAGWMLVLLVTAILFLLFATRMEARIGDLLRQCVWGVG